MSFTNQRERERERNRYFLRELEKTETDVKANHVLVTFPIRHHTSPHITQPMGRRGEGQGYHLASTTTSQGQGKRWREGRLPPFTRKSWSRAAAAATLIQGVAAWANPSSHARGVTQEANLNTVTRAGLTATMIGILLYSCMQVAYLFKKSYIVHCLYQFIWFCCNLFNVYFCDVMPVRFVMG